MKFVFIVLMALSLSACATKRLLIPELVPLRVPETLMKPLPYELQIIQTGNEPEIDDEEI